MFRSNLKDAPESPHTGWGRQHWIECGKYLLEGVFSHVADLEAPIRTPKQAGKSYPQPNDPPDFLRAVEMEGLARSLYIAAPLLREEPGLRIGNIELAQYYRTRLARVTDSRSPEYVPKLSQQGGNIGRQTCEFGGIILPLMIASESLWQPLEREAKERFLDHLSDYAHGITHPQNWRFFNVMMLEFLRFNGRAINEKLLNWHMEQILALYAGDGWYRDGAGFDYYTPWVFHLYGLLWSKWFVKKEDPRTKRFEESLRAFLPNYMRMFSRDGRMILWGRSICYRAAAVAPLALSGLLEDAPIEMGWARRICSGVMRQFVGHPDFLKDHLPSLGAYGPFEPAIQVYSCSASPLWMGLAFMGLYLPEEHAFWKAKESSGAWHRIHGDDSVFLPKAGMMITNRGESGQVELRTGKVNSPGCYYNKLIYHSHLDWCADDPLTGSAAAYALSDEDGGGFRTLVQMAQGPAQDSILYRQATFASEKSALKPRMDLAEVLIPNGVIRLDRPRHHGNAVWRLGHFGLEGSIKTERRECGSQSAMLMDNGTWSLALVILHGWQKIDIAPQRETHLSGKNSTLLFAECASDGVIHPSCLCSVLLQRAPGSKWEDEKLFAWNLKMEAPGEFVLQEKGGKRWVVDFRAFEGDLQK